MEGNRGAGTAGVRTSPEASHPPVLVFRVGGTRFATHVAVVREVIACPQVTPLPIMPKFFEGVVRLRGTVIPIIDLRKRFEVDVENDPKRNRIILAGIEGRILGALVDEVYHVVSLADVAVLAPPRLAEGQIPRFLKGVFQHEEAAVFLLEMGEMLTSGERAAFRDLAVPGAAGHGKRGLGGETSPGGCQP